MGTVREVREMSRYIDADEAVTMIALQMPFIIQGFEDNKRTAQRIIGSLPSIDIVRCKDCRHWIGETEHYEDREYKACWQLCGQYMNSEFWCKYGEREGE